MRACIRMHEGVFGAGAHGSMTTMCAIGGAELHAPPLLQVQCELFFQCDLYIYHKHIQPGELPPCAVLPLGPEPPASESAFKPVVWKHQPVTSQPWAQA